MKLICLIYCIQKIINVPKIFAKKIFFIENLEFVPKNVLSKTWVKKWTTDARFLFYIFIKSSNQIVQFYA